MGDNIEKEERVIFLATTIQIKTIIKIQKNDRIEVDRAIQTVIVEIYGSFIAEIIEIYKWVVAENKIIEVDFIYKFEGGIKNNSW